MAKAQPSLALVEMERILGYKVDSLTYPEESSSRFYSDLRPTPSSTYGKTKKEFEEYEKKAYRKDRNTISEEVLPELDVAKPSSNPTSINAWSSTDKNVVVGFRVSTFDTDFGPKGEWHKGHADSSWDDYIPKESTDKLVVFAGALRYRYSKHFWTDAQLKEEEKKKAPTRSNQLTDGSIRLDGLNANDALVCEEIGADDESEDDED